MIVTFLRREFYVVPFHPWIYFNRCVYINFYYVFLLENYYFEEFAGNCVPWRLIVQGYLCIRKYCRGSQISTAIHDLKFANF